MNIEAWQAQQKAQKDEERKRKSEAAAALQGFRGRAPEEAAAKLTALKQAERIKKKEAEENMHAYHGRVSEEDAKLAALRREERQKRAEADRALHGFHASSPSGKGNSLANDEKKEMYPELISPSKDRTLESIASGSVSAMANMFKGSSEHAPPLEGSTEADTISMIQPAAESPQLQPPPQPTETMVQPMPETVVQLITPSTFRLSFGVISFGEKDSYDMYLMKLFNIMQNCSASVSSSTNIDDTADGVSCNAYPSIENVQQDPIYTDPHGRANIVRSMVTVCCTYETGNSAMGNTFTMQLLNATQQAIHDGSFLE